MTQHLLLQGSRGKMSVETSGKWLYVGGYVLPNNTASERAFARAGFRDRGTVADGSRMFVRTVMP